MTNFDPKINAVIKFYFKRKKNQKSYRFYGIYFMKRSKKIGCKAIKLAT